MLKKIATSLLLSSCLFASDFWEVGFEQGTSIYNISNNKKDKLSFECNESSANLYLYKEDKEIKIDNQLISFIINDEKKLTTTNNPNKSGTESDRMAWNNLISTIPSAKKIIIETNNNEISFEPKNLKELNNFSESCTNYENNPTSNNSTPEENTNSNNTPINDFSENSIKIDLKMERNTYWGYYYQILTITSLIDNLEIKDVKINKGKCKSNISADFFEKNGVLRATKNTYPVTINEYENLKVQTSENCDIMRIDIFTNKGVITQQKR